MAVGLGGPEYPGKLIDDVVELLNAVGLGEVFFCSVLPAFGDILVISGGAPHDFPEIEVCYSGSAVGFSI